MFIYHLLHLILPYHNVDHFAAFPLQNIKVDYHNLSVCRDHSYLNEKKKESHLGKIHQEFFQQIVVYLRKRILQRDLFYEKNGDQMARKSYLGSLYDLEVNWFIYSELT